MAGTSPAIVILSGGAPNSPLVAGALAAIYHGGKTFDIVYGSGAGALLGMLFLAPKNNTVEGALKATLTVAVDDAVYKVFPIGYKTFFKSGPFTKAFVKAAMAFQLTNPAIPDRTRRFYNDLIDLWFAAASPSDTTLLSQGFCLPVPFVSEVVDFALLRTDDMRNRFFMNAYCIEDGKVRNFSNKEITEDHFHAALSFPYVYSPTAIDGKHFFEGSSVDPINFGVLTDIVETLVTTQQIGQSPTYVLIDVLGALESALVRTPRNLIDAFGISIITPICSLAQKVEQIFQNEHCDVKLNRVTFNIPARMQPFLLDWTYSNMHDMWHIGWEAGERFVRDYGDLLPDKSKYPIPAPPQDLP